MEMFSAPTEPTTPSQWGVIAIASAVLFILLGLAGLGVGFFAPPDQREAAAQLMRYGWWFLGLGGFISICYWAIRRFVL